MVAPQLSSRMNWQQRSGQIYANLMEPGLRSIRAIAARDCQSSVHRLVQAIERRHQYPESPCGTPVATSGWVVWAVVYVFGVKRGIGNETLSEFFHILHLEGRIGVSPMQVRAQIEQQILNYRDEQQAQLQQRQARVEVCVGDETF